MEHGGTLTYADLEALPDDGLRRELIDGDLIVTASPVTRHQVIVGRLFLNVANYLDEHGGAQVFFAPLDVLFSERDVVEPDLIVVADADAGIVTEKNIKGVPSLVVEVVSDPRLDRVRKRDLYARFGVPVYWIVDPDADRIEIHRLEGDRFGKPEILEAGDIARVEFLPGLQIDVDALFAR